MLLELFSFVGSTILALWVLDRTLSQGLRKTMWICLFFSLYFSCSILNANIGSVVDLPGLNPNWLSAILIISLSLASIILSHSFIVWLISLIPL